MTSRFKIGRKQMDTKRVAFYFRVSTKEQTYENQRLELEKLAATEGWKDIEIFFDVCTGAYGRDVRRGFDKMLTLAEQGAFDIVAGWAVDRMGRETRDLLDLCASAKKHGFTLFFHKDRIDTATPVGEMFFTIVAAFAKFERERLRERTIAGMERARKQGKVIGCPKVEVKHPEMLDAVRELRAKGNSIHKIAHATGLGRGTICRLIDEYQLDRLTVLERATS